MSSFELNKIVGAVLLAVLALVVIGKLGDYLVVPGGGHGGGDHGAATVTAKAPAPKKEEPLEPIIGMLALADVEAGKRVFNKCKSCHTVDNGGKNGIGPNLWGVVNANHAKHEGFSYSDALTGMTESKWTYENLNKFLAKPKQFAPGTKMNFAGFKKPEERAEVVRFLRDHSDSPIPLE